MIVEGLSPFSTGCERMLLYRVLADVIVVAHALFVAFVEIGMVVIVTGLVRGWSCSRNFWFRVSHLSAIGLVVILTVIRVDCPLTTWEKELRDNAGEATYPGGFIAYWMHKLIFYDLPPWVFTLS